MLQYASKATGRYLPELISIAWRMYSLHEFNVKIIIALLSVAEKWHTSFTISDFCKFIMHFSFAFLTFCETIRIPFDVSVTGSFGLNRNDPMLMLVAGNDAFKLSAVFNTSSRTKSAHGNKREKRNNEKLRIQTKNSVAHLSVFCRHTHSSNHFYIRYQMGMPLIWPDRTAFHTIQQLWFRLIYLGESFCIIREWNATISMRCLNIYIFLLVPSIKSIARLKILIY